MRGATLLAVAALAVAPTLAKGPAYQEPKPVDGGKVVKVKLDFNIAKAAPDCFLRNVYTVNGKFGIHTIQAHRGDVLDVEVINNIPADYPDVHDGITIHWHGLTMPDSNYWYDGAAYVTQCPLYSGKTQHYKFLLVDGPGLFWWHSHVGLQAMDGIFGPLVILPSRNANATAAAVPAADGGDLILATGDWWHSTGAAIAFPLGRPFDKAKQTPQSGPYYWSDVPQAIHMNGRALWIDCALEPYLGNASVPCKPEKAWIAPGRAAGNVGATPSNPGCARTNFTVTPGKTYKWRVINVGALMDLNVCVEGHNLTIVAADGIPVEPLSVGSCFTISLGQRFDVLMKADAKPGTYWVVSQANYRPSSPNGYAVLRYDTPGAPALPPTPAPSGQPVPHWTPTDLAKLKMPLWLAGRADPPPGVVPSEVAHVMPNATTLKLPERSTRFVFINNTQPILPTGQVRWALNQVVMSETPKCDAFAEHVQRSGSKFIEDDFEQTVREGEGADVGVSLGVQDVNRTETPVYVYGRNGSQPVTPSVGKQVILLEVGDVVDVVIQNLPPGENNGAVKRPANAPTVQEPHPFHIHGVHFWLLGTGVGSWNESLLDTDMNWWDPPMRDTAMLPPYGWVMFRFVAAYPGVWLLHCHALLHLYMGQALLFVVSPDTIPSPPPTLPPCKAVCSAAMAPWDQAYVAKKWPNTPYDVGPLPDIQDSLGKSAVEGVVDGDAVALGGVPADGSTSPAPQGGGGDGGKGSDPRG